MSSVKSSCRGFCIAPVLWVISPYHLLYPYLRISCGSMHINWHQFAINQDQLTSIRHQSRSIDINSPWFFSAVSPKQIIFPSTEHGSIDMEATLPGALGAQGRPILATFLPLLLAEICWTWLYLWLYGYIYVYIYVYMAIYVDIWLYLWLCVSMYEQRYIVDMAISMYVYLIRSDPIR